MRCGARDLAVAVLAGLSRLDEILDTNGRSDVGEAVFDGRWLYNLVLNHLGQDLMERNDYSPISGSALRCGVKIERIAWFRRNHSRRKWTKSDGAKLWTGQAFANFPPVPERMELDTILGGFRKYLVRTTLNNGSRIRPLPAAN